MVSGSVRIDWRYVFSHCRAWIYEEHKRSAGIAEVGRDQWRQGQGRDEATGDTEMETEGHKEEKELMNLLQLQGFS